MTNVETQCINKSILLSRRLSHTLRRFVDEHSEKIDASELFDILRTATYWHFMASMDYLCNRIVPIEQKNQFLDEIEKTMMISFASLRALTNDPGE